MLDTNPSSIHYPRECFRRLTPAHRLTSTWLLGIVVGTLGMTNLQAAAEGSAEKSAWWNKEWSVRKEIRIKAPADLPAGQTVALARLHEGNFQFVAAKEDGSDLRVTSADGKSELPFHWERYDPLMNEGFLWLGVPDLKPGEERVLWVYYGNQTAAASELSAPAATYADDAVLVYHFAGNGAPRDSSKNANHASAAGVSTEGALIGAGLRLTPISGIEVPASDSLKWAAAAPTTISFWLKPAAADSKGLVLSRADGAASLVVGLDAGVPYFEIKDESGTQRGAAGSAMAAGKWGHIALVAGAGKCDLFVDGAPMASVAKALPALASAIRLGGASDGGGGVTAEMDEFKIRNREVSAGLLKFEATSQSGSKESAELLVIGSDETAETAEAHGEALEHLMLFGDIAKNMMFDGWVVVFACGIMAIVGWWVAIGKFIYLNRVEKANNAFLSEWKKLAADLTALDREEADGTSAIGDGTTRKKSALLKQSPLYHLYHIGSDEIRHRMQNTKGGFKGLAGRSIQAIKASLDSGLVHENHRLNKGLVFLTISIAGGPYVGLLGTVMGVMITFAVIAKTGEVEVNSIAPGIASALLATVAGLIVAIPALFIYSYLASRIKNAVSDMQIFIDEFITKMAEFYRESPDAQESAKAGITKEVL